MDTNTKRIDAVRALLEDEDARRSRDRWESILADNALSPGAKTPGFEQQFYDLLIMEMEDGYKRKEALQREKRKKTGRSSGYIPPQMRISPDIGRFLFAYFKWHGFDSSQTSAKVDNKGLDDLAEAFGFKIDPLENRRQFIDAGERKTIIEKEEGTSYNLRMLGLIIGGLFITFAIVVRYLMRRGGL